MHVTRQNHVCRTYPKRAGRNALTHSRSACAQRGQHLACALASPSKPASVAARGTMPRCVLPCRWNWLARRRLSSVSRSATCMHGKGSVDQRPQERGIAKRLWQRAGAAPSLNVGLQRLYGYMGILSDRCQQSLLIMALPEDLEIQVASHYGLQSPDEQGAQPPCYAHHTQSLTAAAMDSWLAVFGEPPSPCCRERASYSCHAAILGARH